MGGLVGKTMDENLKKQQEFMLKQSQLQLERQIQMQNAMRERQIAIQIAQSRDLFQWWLTFYGVALVGGIAGFRKRRSPVPLMPLIPLTFIVSYLGDLAYGTKINRIRDEADRILDQESGLLSMPHGLPSFNEIEMARLQQKDMQAIQQGHDIFL